MADPNGQYSQQDFWAKLKKFAVQAGREVVEKALILFYTAERPETPSWAKMVIYSALAYFILPTDAIPDFIPVTGFSDDLGALAAVFTAVAMNITPEVQAAAKQKVKEWLGDEPTTEQQDSPQAEHPIREISIE